MELVPDGELAALAGLDAPSCGDCPLAVPVSGGPSRAVPAALDGLWVACARGASADGGALALSDRSLRRASSPACAAFGWALRDELYGRLEREWERGCGDRAAAARTGGRFA
jgi:hypothetical protein